MFQLLTDFVVWLFLLWFSITHGQNAARRLDRCFSLGSDSPFQDF